MSSITTLAINFLIAMLKWFFNKRAARKLSNKEFVEAMLEHHEQRANAGQSALDWKASLAKLKARIAKKKEE